MLEWHLRNRIMMFERPLVMGIVNVTPDSFSDGGQRVSAEAGTAHGLKLAEQGADILDVGGESTRPGAAPVPVEEELRRVLPVVRGLAAECVLPLSVDTYKAEVARACLDAGAHIVNDIFALQGDPGMAEVVRAHQAGVILMHLQGTPETMQREPHYDDVMAEIGQFFEERLHFAARAGITREQIVLDPGIGFGKRGSHNLEILARLAEFQRLGRPICLGVSRKGFIGSLNGRPVDRRLAGSLAAVCHALSKSAAQILRVHDVEETRDAVNLFLAIEERGQRMEDRGSRIEDRGSR